MSRLIDALEQLFDGSEPLANGLIDFFESGSSTLRKTTYSDPEKTIPNSNPLKINGDGVVPNVYGDGTYRIIIRTENSVQLRYRDPVGGDISLGYGSEWLADQVYSTSDVVRDAGAYWISQSESNIGNRPSLDSGSNWVDYLADVPVNADDIAANAANISINATDIATNTADILAISPPTPASGFATFTNSTNNISLVGIGAIEGLEAGDVLQVSGSTNNNTEFTVEVITDANNVIVNQAHAGGTTSKSLIDETATVVIKLLSKWYNAEIGLGQGWVDVTASRTATVNHPSLTNRSMRIAVSINLVSSGLTVNLYEDLVAIKGAFFTEMGNNNIFPISEIITMNSTYKIDDLDSSDLITKWLELR